MSVRRSLFFGGGSAALLAWGIGCANSPSATTPTAAAPLAMASAPSTQPVVDSCVNEATVEFDSSWSSFRFAEQSNSATVKLTAPAPPVAPALPPATQPTGASDASADRGGATPDAVRGQSSADAIRGYANADARRGYATAAGVRGNADADAARGSFTVQVLRGGAEVIAARHDNSSAVVRPDLSVTLTADPPAAAPGDTVVYTITIRNISSIEARDVIVTDYLPEELETRSAVGATITTDPDDSSTHLTIPGSIAPGASVKVQLLARVKSSASRP